MSNHEFEKYGMDVARVVADHMFAGRGARRAAAAAHRVMAEALRNIVKQDGGDIEFRTCLRMDGTAPVLVCQMRGRATWLREAARDAEPSEEMCDDWTDWKDAGGKS